MICKGVIKNTGGKQNRSNNCALQPLGCGMVVRNRKNPEKKEKSRSRVCISFESVTLKKALLRSSYLKHSRAHFKMPKFCSARSCYLARS